MNKAILSKTYEMFIHLFNFIEPAPKRTRAFPPFILNEEELIKKWENNYGFTIEEYTNFNYNSIKFNK